VRYCWLLNDSATWVWVFIYIFIQGNSYIIYIYIYIYNVSPSGISDLCGTVAGMVTPKGSTSTEGQTLQVSVLPYRSLICPPFVMRQMSIL
jgi:hypothetical protein